MLNFIPPVAWILVDGDMIDYPDSTIIRLWARAFVIAEPKSDERLTGRRAVRGRWPASRTGHSSTRPGVLMFHSSNHEGQ